MLDQKEVNLQEIQETIIDFVAQQFVVDKEEIELDKSLVQVGIIDSIGLIEIASFIEKKYGFTVTEKEMNRENFGSIIRMSEFIQKRLG